MRRTALIITISAVLAITGTAAAIVAGFPDVPDDHVHANGIQWASDNGLMRGYDNGNFGPDDPVTRGQLSTIFFRYDNTLDDAGTGGVGTQGPPGPPGAPGAPGAPGTDAQVTAQVAVGAAPAGINIGGSIADDHTVLENSHMTLAPGAAYLIQVYGSFQMPNTNGGAVECDLLGGADVWPQLTFWIDGNGNDVYDGGEGVISPNVLMPDCNGRHANVSGEFTIPALTEATTVGLVAFGYTSTGGTEGDGIIGGGGALIASPLGSLELSGDLDLPAFEGEGGG